VASETTEGFLFYSWEGGTLGGPVRGVTIISYNSPKSLVSIQVELKYANFQCLYQMINFMLFYERKVSRSLIARNSLVSASDLYLY
jgi:hypothetical protein